MGYLLAMVQLVAYFLRRRSFQVGIGQNLSDSRQKEAALPEGAVLSSKLYSIHPTEVPKRRHRYSIAIVATVRTNQVKIQKSHTIIKY